MSLLDCICCRRHGHRTAVVWDDLLAPSCLSYSVLVEKGCRVACYLRHTAWVTRGGMVGLYGSNCSDVLCALLGILAVPAAYVPVDRAQPAAVNERTLRKLGISNELTVSPLLMLAVQTMTKAAMCSNGLSPAL